MRILLVEDEAPKSAHIIKVLTQCGVDSTNIETARSVDSALDKLESSVQDLLLLDMSLPTFDIGEQESGGRPQGFGGIEILRYMTLADIRCPTIVITGYEAFLREGGHVDLTQLREELNSEFPHLVKDLLHYNSTYDEWRTVLKQTLNEFMGDK